MSTSSAPSMRVRIESKIREHFNPSHFDILDTSGGCGQSFKVTIVSDMFNGKSILQRHKLVNEKLKVEIAEMHAFSQQCLTPAQYQSSESANSN